MVEEAVVVEAARDIADMVGVGRVIATTTVTTRITTTIIMDPMPMAAETVMPVKQILLDVRGLMMLPRHPQT